MPLSTTGADVGSDRLLDDYRSARAQQVLFDVRGGSPGLGAFGATGYDEFIESSGEVRPAWRELGDLLGERGPEGLGRLREVVGGLVDNDGITYIEIDRHGEAVTDTHGMAMPGPWHLDGIPLLVSAADWQTLEAGVIQRSRLLDAVLRDIYGEQRSLTSGVLPPQLIFGHPGYLRAVRGIHDPADNHLFMLGCDVSRCADGHYRVNADWTQAPPDSWREEAGRILSDAPGSAVTRDVRAPVGLRCQRVVHRIGVALAEGFGEHGVKHPVGALERQLGGLALQRRGQRRERVAGQYVRGELGGQPAEQPPGGGRGAP